jgi:hypothetical protein
MKKTDLELMVVLGAHLRTFREARTSLTLRLPIAGLADADELRRAVHVAKAKWYLENVTQVLGPEGPSWTVDLTGRGAEALGLD